MGKAKKGKTFLFLKGKKIYLVNGTHSAKSPSLARSLAAVTSAGNHIIAYHTGHTISLIIPSTKCAWQSPGTEREMALRPESKSRSFPPIKE